MPVVELTSENFEATVQDNDIVLVDFWASWCGPCQMFAPIYEAAAERYPNVVFGKVNTEEQQELAAHFGIRSIPTLMLFRDKVVLFQQAGVLPESALDDVVKKAQELDMEEVHKQIAEQQAAGAAS